MLRRASLVFCLLLAFPAGAALSDFDTWIGTWERIQASGRVTRERWWKDGSSLRGESRERTADATTWKQTESLLLTEMLGGVYYIAQPRDNPYPVAFRLNSADGVAIFENPTHDFPQSISYAVVAGESLRVWIEGTRDGEPRRIEFLFKQVPEAASEQ